MKLCILLIIVVSFSCLVLFLINWQEGVDEKAHLEWLSFLKLQEAKVAELRQNCNCPFCHWLRNEESNATNVFDDANCEALAYIDKGTAYHWQIFKLKKEI